MKNKTTLRIEKTNPIKANFKPRNRHHLAGHGGDMCCILRQVKETETGKLLE
jgi:hypothetical protein